MAIKVLDETKVTTLNMQLSDMNYLAEKGINRSKLMRQVVQSMKEGTFVYQYNENRRNND